MTPPRRKKPRSRNRKRALARRRVGATVEPAPIAEEVIADWLPVAGIGASAGGLDALLQVLRRLPDQPGLPIVIVQHLSPHHKSLLSEILQEATKMPVTQVNTETQLLSNHVYVIPPDRFLVLHEGRLR